MIKQAARTPHIGPLVLRCFEFSLRIVERALNVWLFQGSVHLFGKSVFLEKGQLLEYC